MITHRSALRINYRHDRVRAVRIEVKCGRHMQAGIAMHATTDCTAWNWTHCPRDTTRRERARRSQLRPIKKPGAERAPPHPDVASDRGIAVHVATLHSMAPRHDAPRVRPLPVNRKAWCRARALTDSPWSLVASPTE